MNKSSAFKTKHSMKKYLALCLLLIAQITIAQDITTFPYATSFEEIEGNLVEEYPEGWTAEDLNTVEYGNQTWQSVKNSSLSQNAHTGETAIHMMSHFTEDNNDWLFTPSIGMVEGEVYTLKFWYTAKVFTNTVEKIKVHIAGENNAISMLETTELWKDEEVNEEVWKLAEITYIAENSGTYYFGFHYYSTMFNFMFIMDDIEIQGSNILGLENQDSFNYQLLGNPVQSEILVSLKSSVSTVANLYSMDGSLIKSQKIAKGSSNMHMNVSDLPQGSYFLNLINNNQSKMEKIIISR